VKDIIGILASSGANDMIYYVTNKTNEATIASTATEFAGGSNTSTASAYLSFAVLSFLQKGAHSAFPAGAAAKLSLPCKWNGGSGTLADWIAAGYPLDSFHIDINFKVLGTE
jgi:hypothetical protein